jgi:hypothetical protein
MPDCGGASSSRLLGGAAVSWRWPATALARADEVVE